MSKSSNSWTTKEHKNENVQREKPYVYHTRTQVMGIQQYDRNTRYELKALCHMHDREESLWVMLYDEELRNTYATKWEVWWNVKLWE